MPQPEIDRHTLAQMAREAGLTVAGVTTPEPFREAEYYIIDHVGRGHTSGMDWFTRDRASQSAEPRTLHETVTSIVSVAVPFWGGPATPPDDGILRGRIARYAWGRDYHKTLKRRMQQFLATIEDTVGRSVESRELVDTARAFDREIARRSGVGWFGKNSMIIVPGHGSWVMLGELYLDVRILPDLPIDKDCGRCTICIDRCPTGAIVSPYRIDAPRCISYLTIEERGPLPHELRPQMGNWVFGCDVCQDVCPYTKAAKQIIDPEFQPATIENIFPSLERLAKMNHDEYLATYAGTAVTRAKRRGLARNAAVALGNSGDPAAEPVLHWMLFEHDEPLARGHAAWSLTHLTGTGANAALRRARDDERDPYVIEEIDIALGTADADNLTTAPM